MSKYSSKDLTLTVAGHDLSAYLLTIGAFKVTPITEDGTPFDESWAETVFTGLRQGESIPIGGFYDDTATTGPDALLGTLETGQTVAVVITWGGSKTSSFNAIVGPYERAAAVKKMTRFTSTLIPTGAVTEA